jgi:hypothetical protein
MAIPNSVFSGGCACGKVRFTVTAQPKRVGLCHCMTCRKAHGAAFNPFVVFATEEGSQSRADSRPDWCGPGVQPFPEKLMAKLNREWIVQPHGELIAVADGILTVEGSIVMPLGKLPRRMTVLALRSDRPYPLQRRCVRLRRGPTSGLP